MNFDNDQAGAQEDCRVANATSIESVAYRTLKALSESKKRQAVIGEAHLRAFCSLLLKADSQACLDLVAVLRGRGERYEVIVDCLVSRAARELGARWDNDVLSFTQVSVGISTLLAVNAALRSTSDNAAITRPEQILFATLPHQTHTLGIGLASEAFRQRGWDTKLCFRLSEADILDEVICSKADLVGFTAGRTTSLSQLIMVVRQLQQLPNPPHVMLGGIAAVSNAEEVNGIECVTVIESLEHALKVAEALLAR